MNRPGSPGSSVRRRGSLQAMVGMVGRLGWWRLGLVGVACVMLGSGWYQVWFGPPYRYVDEQAHVGYVLEVQAGRLPSIDAPIDAVHGGPELRERLASELPRRRDVWVANNPPLPYVVAAGPAAITRALGIAGGPLVGLRLVNLAAMTAAVVLSCRVARSLSGGDARAGLLAGAVTAAVPHTGFLAGMGMTDGLALLATVGTIDAASRTDGLWTRRWWARLFQWAAAGAAVRPMTAVLCGAVVGMALAVRAFAIRARPDGAGTRDPGPTEAEPPGSASPSLVAAGLVSVVSAGWYLRNLVEYGDPTGSDRLFAKFGRVPRPLSELSIWSDGKLVIDTLFLRRLQNELDTDPLGWSPVVLAILALGVVGVLAMAIRERGPRRRLPPALARPESGRGGAERGPVRLDLAILLGAVTAVNLVLVARHWTGGGGLHPRYALLLVPVLASFVATVVARFSVAAALALVAAPLVVLWYQVPASSTWVNDHKTAPLTSPLTMSIGPEWLRLAGLALVAGGAVVVAAALVRLGADAAWRTRGEEG